jgi:hypothetical protein
MKVRRVLGDIELLLRGGYNKIQRETVQTVQTVMNGIDAR